MNTTTTNETDRFWIRSNLHLFDLIPVEDVLVDGTKCTFLIRHCIPGVPARHTLRYMLNDCSFVRSPGLSMMETTSIPLNDVYIPFSRILRHRTLELAKSRARQLPFVDSCLHVRTSLRACGNCDQRLMLPELVRSIRHTANDCWRCSFDHPGSGHTHICYDAGWTWL